MLVLWEKPVLSTELNKYDRSFFASSISAPVVTGDNMQSDHKAQFI